MGPITIALYSDVGADSTCLNLTEKAFKNSLGNEAIIKKVKASDLANSKSQWEKETTLLVIGGGNARNIMDTLGVPSKTDSAGSRIHQYVKNQAGKFLGICAGSACAASGIYVYTDIQSDVNMGKISPGLNLFNGLACSFNETLEYMKPIKWQGKVLASKSTLKESQVVKTAFESSPCLLYNADQKVSVLATYDSCSIKPKFDKTLDRHSSLFSSLPSIIHCTFGTGEILLTATHLEVRRENMPTLIPEHFSKRKEHSDLDDASINAVWDECLIRLLPSGEKQAAASDSKKDSQEHDADDPFIHCF